jgi:hypothetical protein
MPDMEGKRPKTMGRAAKFTLALLVGFPLGLIAIFVMVALCQETTWGGWAVGLIVPVVAIWLLVRHFKSGNPEERAARMAGWKDAGDSFEWGALNSAMVCPHCQTRGQVRSKRMSRKKGISGAKATGALLTSGLSILATGLSRKEQCTQAHCGNCGSTWDF